MDFINNKFNLSIQDIDKLYHIMNNLKKDRGYSLSTITLMVMERFDLTDVYYNWDTYLKTMNDEK